VSIGDKRVVLALVQLVSGGMRKLVGVASGEVGLHVALPGAAAAFDLVDDVGNVDGDVVVVGDAVRTTGCGGYVIGLAGVRHAGVVGGEAVGRSGGIDPRRVRVPDQMAVAGVLHHDHPDVLEVLEVAASVGGGGGADGTGHGERYDRKRCGQRKHQDASKHKAPSY